MSSPDQELSALLGTQAVGIAVLDRELRYVHVNALVAALNQAPAEAHVGKTVREMMPRGGALLGPLLEQVLASAAKSIGRVGLEFSAAQRARLTGYEWPGNIRELEHVIERAVILSRSPPLRLDLALPSQDSETVPPRTPGLAPSAPDRVLKDVEVRALERESIKQALERAEFRVAGKGGAAEMLGLSPSTLRDRMKTLGIARRA
jgi:DNA-binding NtrC family response regulator